MNSNKLQVSHSGMNFCESKFLPLALGITFKKNIHS
jgi:hypothetical protein